MIDRYIKIDREIDDRQLYECIFIKLEWEHEEEDIFRREGNVFPKIKTYSSNKIVLQHYSFLFLTYKDFFFSRKEN